ncbi:DUF2691 family protein [Paenibacillus sp. FSL L8-0436]|uniref:DUF2691 family protein n=1 Tax=Paenibacillus sp. FSL L8-0436 TaxID=2954686 RepID=UPI003158D7DD
MEKRIRGITFEIPNEYGKWLYHILRPLDCTKYNWLIGPGEEYKSVDHELVSLFPPGQDRVDGEVLMGFIDTEEAQYIIHLDLKAYSSVVASQLKTYEDYLASDCELVLLIVDCIYTTIYCKDSETLDKLAANAEALHVRSLNYITDANDHRTGLGVW